MSSETLLKSQFVALTVCQLWFHIRRIY